MARKRPDGYHTVTPYIVARDGDGVLAFIKAAFDGEVLERMDTPGGMHSEIRIGDSRVMVGGKKDGSDASPAMFYLYVDDADAAYARMLAAGGTSIEAPNDQDYGDRRAGAKDPCGNQWYVAHRR
jgi:PhnB protein